MLNRNALYCLIFLMVTFAVPRDAKPLPQKSSPSLLKTGSFPGVIVKAKSGERWWALYTSKKGAYLKKKTIQIQPVFEPYSDRHKDKTGKKVSVRGSQKPYLLLKGIRGLRQGGLKTVFLGDEELIPPKKVGFTLQGKRYYIRISGKRFRRKHQNGYKNYKIILDGPSGSLELFSVDIISDRYTTLEWIGDLNRDGFPDLIIDTGLKFSGSTTLFLSHKSRKGFIIKKAAIRDSIGC